MIVWSQFICLTCSHSKLKTSKLHFYLHHLPFAWFCPFLPGFRFNSLSLSLKLFSSRPLNSEPFSQKLHISLSRFHSETYPSLLSIQLSYRSLLVYLGFSMSVALNSLHSFFSFLEEPWRRWITSFSIMLLSFWPCFSPSIHKALSFFTPLPICSFSPHH